MSRWKSPLLRAVARSVAALLLTVTAEAAEVRSGEDTPLAGEVEAGSDAARSPARLVEMPLSISVVSRGELEPGPPGLALDEALSLVPGLFAQSGRNFAQDARVSIRGFGARAGFGIRGIRILVDGVPTTLPDGQSEVDSLDLAFVERIDVLRGPASSLHGGGGGGVVSVSTLRPTETPVLRLRSVIGSSRLARHELSATGRHRGTGYVLGLTTTHIGGHRDHARARHRVWLGKLERTLADGTRLEGQISGVWAPEAQDPGGLTQEELDRDPERARPGARAFDAGERLDQQRVALRMRRPLGPGRELEIGAYHLRREFANKLPFNRQVRFGRRVSGTSLLYSDRSRRVDWMLGADLGLQRDHRRNHENVLGARGALTLRQVETVRTLGVFGQAELPLAEGLGAVAGLRYDWTEFVVDDRLQSGDVDRSDRLRFRELSPRIGLHYGRSERFHVYANYATAFRVPTTTELAPADGVGGFDSDVEPERTRGLEIGAKGILAGRLAYDVAVFQLEIRNALVPFENPTGGAGAETSFRNAGVVRRRGVELGLSLGLAAGLSLRAVYTGSDFRFRDFDPVIQLPGGGTLVTDLDGKREPNVPRHSLAAELRYAAPSGLFATLSLRHFSDLQADDANTVESAGATLSDLRVGFRWRSGGLELMPMLGVLNWTGADYAGSLRPGARAERFFEPAPATELYIALQLRLLR